MWNIATLTFIKNYVYLRSIDKKDMKNSKKRIRATIISFAFGAFWHGLYPGYYIGYFHYFLHSTVAEYFINMNKKGDKTIQFLFQKLNFLNHFIHFYYYRFGLELMAGYFYL